MFTTTCPFCYRHINRHKLAFQCSGNGQPGFEKCERKVSSARRARTGYQGTMRQVFEARPILSERLRGNQLAYCTSCRAKSGGRACPDCHTPLPPGFGRSRSPLIAMVGAYGSGKSVYLTVLAHMLLETLPERFDASIEITEDAHGDEISSEAWISNNIGALFEERRLFPQTARAVGGRQEPVVFQWRQRRRLGMSNSYLSFYDTAGEDLSEGESTRDLEYLSQADGLILLLDPFTLKGARDQAGLPASPHSINAAADGVLSRVTHALQKKRGNARKVKIPVAATFAKMDAFFEHLPPHHPIRKVEPAANFYRETVGQELHDHVRDLLHDWGGEKIDRHLHSNYTQFRYFPVSSLGEPPNYETSTIAARGVQPFRVEEPLLWLLARNGVVPSRK